jgi:hypothetical protein
VPREIYTISGSPPHPESRTCHSYLAGVACSPVTTQSELRHFDRSDSRFHRESRSGEIRFSTAASSHSPKRFAMPVSLHRPANQGSPTDRAAALVDKRPQPDLSPSSCHCFFFRCFLPKKRLSGPLAFFPPQNPEPASQNPRQSSLSAPSAQPKINPKTVACLPPPTRYTVNRSFFTRNPSFQSRGTA